MATTINAQPISWDEIEPVSGAVSRETVDEAAPGTGQCIICFVSPGLNKRKIQASALMPKTTKLMVVRIFPDGFIGLLLTFTINTHPVNSQFIAFSYNIHWLNQYIKRIDVHCII